MHDLLNPSVVHRMAVLAFCGTPSEKHTWYLVNVYMSIKLAVIDMLILNTTYVATRCIDFRG